MTTDAHRKKGNSNSNKLDTVDIISTLYKPSNTVVSRYSVVFACIIIFTR